MKKLIASFFAVSMALGCMAAEPRTEISTSDAMATVTGGRIAGYTEEGIKI